MLRPLTYVLFSFLLLSNHALGVKVGEAAPNFELIGHDGKKYSLSNYKGKNVVLEWYNDDCPYVQKHYDSGNMQALQKKYTEKGIVWLSVISSAEGKQGFLKVAEASKKKKTRKAMQTAILIDESGKVGKLYSAKTTPHMYIIDPKGRLVYQGAIDDKPSARQSSLKGAKNFVSIALNETLSGKKISKPKTKPYGCSVKY